MSEQEIFSMIIDELTEHALEERRKELAAKNKDYNADLLPLSRQLETIVSRLLKEDADIINRYINKSSAIADGDCTFLYIQGAKDCVRLLKGLGVI